MDVYEKALLLHEQWQGKLSTELKAKLENAEDLTYAYTPGVARPCMEISKDPSLAYKYTSKANTIAVISDGTAVLGLGDIGPEAAMPVMEGKAVLFKEFGQINAVPICLDTQDTEEIIKTIVNIAPAFGGINLEDISAPRCFEIEERLKELLDIPVFHDDQHGTAIVVLAGIINALKVTGKQKDSCKVIVNGAGSAGIAITKLLLTYGFSHITMCDINGILSKNSPNLNYMQKYMTEVTNLEEKEGTQRIQIGETELLVYYGEPKPYSIRQEIYISFLPRNEFVTAGVWKIQMMPGQVVDKLWQMWLPVQNALNIGTAFLKPDSSTTLTIPSTASLVITVAAYNALTFSYADFSGRGPTQIYEGENANKPDLAAPGVRVMAPVAGGGYAEFTGTSFATPFVTGSAALLMEWGIVKGNDPYLYGEKVKAYLRRGARQIPGYERWPNGELGYGRLCIVQSIPGM